MSTNKLAQVIRKIVREEVRKEVRQLLNEESKPKKVTKSEFNNGLAHALGLQDSIERRARKPKVTKQYTKNKMLNEIIIVSKRGLIPISERVSPKRYCIS